MLSSTAGAADYQGVRLGEFVEAGEHGGRPYFRQRDTEGSNEEFLFSEGGYWIVGPDLGVAAGGLLNNLNRDHPPIDGWIYGDGTNWRGDDTSFTLEFTTLSPCQLVRVAGEGDVVEKQGSSLGDYRSVAFL